MNLLSSSLRPHGFLLFRTAWWITIPLLAMFLVRVGNPAPEPPPTFSMEYLVRIDAADPTTARISWKFAGIDEIAYIRLGIDRGDFFDFSGTGTLEEPSPEEIVWTPRSPYARLDYSVRLRHRRAVDEGFDAYATEEWVIAPAKLLFPSARVSVNRNIEPDPRPDCRVRFLLPSGWKAWSTMRPAGVAVFRPLRSGRFLDRPNGWIALGKMEARSRRIAGTRVEIVRAPGSDLPSGRILDLYGKTLPLLRRLHGRSPERLLIVSGPDPMWRGGISGKNSLYLHGDRPLRTPDRTSPPLHEIFHVLAPFRPASDGRWITEGLAEYYSLALQHRAGILKDRDFQRGLELFQRYGEWNVDLTTTRTLAATNNSAPLVMYALDAEIRRGTDGARSLDDVVRELVGRSKRVTTPEFLGIVRMVTEGQNFTAFFQRHVFSGHPPTLPEARHSRARPASEEISDREVNFADRLVLASIELEAVVETDRPDGGLVP